MPYSMPFGEQDNKWFSIVIFIGLPFFVFYKILVRQLPPLKDVRPKF